LLTINPESNNINPGNTNRPLPSVRSWPTIHMMNIVTLTTSAAADGIGNPMNSPPSDLPGSELSTLNRARRIPPHTR